MTALTIIITASPPRFQLFFLYDLPTMAMTMPTGPLISGVPKFSVLLTSHLVLSVVLTCVFRLFRHVGRRIIPSQGKLGLQ